MYTEGICSCCFEILPFLYPFLVLEAEEEADEQEPTFISLQDGIISVHPPTHSWGIVSSSSNGMKCLACKSNSLSCVHVGYIVDSLESDSCPDFVADFFEACIESESRGSSCGRRPKCLSFRPISFKKPGSLRGLIVLGDEILSAADEADVCPFCGAEPLSCSRAKEITLYTQYKREIVYGKIPSLCFLIPFCYFSIYHEFIVYHGNIIFCFRHAS